MKPWNFVIDSNRFAYVMVSVVIGFAMGTANAQNIQYAQFNAKTLCFQHYMQSKNPRVSTDGIIGRGTIRALNRVIRSTRFVGSGSSKKVNENHFDEAFGILGITCVFNDVGEFVEFVPKADGESVAVTSDNKVAQDGTLKKHKHVDAQDGTGKTSNNTTVKVDTSSSKKSPQQARIVPGGEPNVPTGKPLSQPPFSIHVPEVKIQERVKFSAYTDLEISTEAVILKINSECLKENDFQLHDQVGKLFDDALENSDFQTLAMALLGNGAKSLSFEKIRKNKTLYGSFEEFTTEGGLFKFLTSSDGFQLTNRLENSKYHILTFSNFVNPRDIFDLLPGDRKLREEYCVDFLTFIYKDTASEAPYYYAFSRVIEAVYAKGARISKINSEYSKNEIYSVLFKGSRGKEDIKLSSKQERLLMLGSRADPFEILTRLEGTGEFSYLSPNRL